MKTIAVEEHFATPNYLEQSWVLCNKDKAYQESIEEYNLNIELVWVRPDNPINKPLVDVDEGRIREMDTSGVDMQVLSLRCPGIQVFDTPQAISLAKETNDALSIAVRKHPDKFVGLAAITPQDPMSAVDELERSVTKLGLKGVNINSSTKGEYLDDKKFWPIFETAEKLGVPVYIHPRIPSNAMIKPYLGYPFLAQAFFGYGAEVGIHAVRLMCSAIFDEFPKLNIILGHLGEALPFWMWRMDNIWSRTPLSKKMKHSPSHYLKNNFYVSTSGNFSLPSLRCAIDVCGIERILFAIDYPIEDSSEAVEFIRNVPISERDKEMICHINAERLFSL